MILQIYILKVWDVYDFFMFMKEHILCSPRLHLPKVTLKNSNIVKYVLQFKITVFYLKM